MKRTGPSGSSASTVFKVSGDTKKTLLLMLKKHTRNLVAQKLVHKDFINDVLDKFTNFYKECTAMRRQRQSKPHIN